MDDELEELDDSCMFLGPGTLKVWVPPKPPPHPDDYKLDFPPGEPPEVHYHGVTHNYWTVLQEGKMPYLEGTKVFNVEQMDWLRSIQNEVDNFLRSRR